MLVPGPKPSFKLPLVSRWSAVAHWVPAGDRGTITQVILLRSIHIVLRSTLAYPIARSQTHPSITYLHTHITFPGTAGH